MRPVPRRFRVSQRYGVRDARYAAGFHTGVDYACPAGTRVRSPRRGRVVVSAWDGEYGHYVVVQGRFRGRRKRWLFAHLRRRRAFVGERVHRGEVIGLSGASGNTRGAHLHAEQRHKPFTYWDTERPTAF